MPPRNGRSRRNSEGLAPREDGDERPRGNTEETEEILRSEPPGSRLRGRSKPSRLEPNPLNSLNAAAIGRIVADAVRQATAAAA